MLIISLVYTVGWQSQDLGPQIGYRNVFIIEYAGPIFIMLAYAARPELIFGPGAASKDYNDVAKLGIICWLGHFLKREFETLFVHRYDKSFIDPLCQAHSLTHLTTIHLLQVQPTDYAKVKLGNQLLVLLWLCSGDWVPTL